MYKKDAKLPNEFNLSSSGPHLAMSVGRCIFCPCVLNLIPMVSKGRIPSAAKAASGRNAITHGLTASAPFMRRVELLEDWDHHLERVRRQHEPEGYFETQLAVLTLMEPW